MKYKFNELTIIPQKRFKNQGFTKKLNTGLDTETYQGYVKLIASSYGNYKFIDDLFDIMNFLCANQFRNKFNWFFNIQFDFESIIKYLSKSELEYLYRHGRVSWEMYDIVYLPKKFFSVKDKNNHHYYFFDMYNFLDTSLNNAADKFLKDKKLDVIDSSKLNTDLNYWDENRENIIKYNIKDAVLTKQLADYFWNIISDKINFYPKRPFSKGRLSEEYFLQTCYIPTINDIPKSVLKYAYNNYSGGRFEILKRGYAENVISYDIKSAYPAEIAVLKDFSNGIWRKSHEVNQDTDYGVYYCRVNCYEDYFSPFMQKIGMLNIYPNGSFFVYLNSDEIKFIRKHFYNTDIKIIRGYDFEPFEDLFPFQEKILELYKWKETEKDEDIKYCVKIILNSLYGKMIQTVNGRTGKLFNPLWATFITSRTRLKLLDLALQNPYEVVAFSTDSVHSLKKLQVPEKAKLGEFSKDFEGHGIYIMSDIYSLWNDKKQKQKFRGFKIYADTIVNILETLEIDNDNYTLISILQNLKNDTKYTINYNRPKHLGECLIQKNIEGINIFQPMTKTIDINGDNKRIWDKNFKSGLDVFNGMINSKPIAI